MKRLTFTLFFIAQALCLSAQDSIELTDMVLDILNSIEQKKLAKPIEININNQKFQTLKPTLIQEGKTAIISAHFVEEEGLFLIKKTPLNTSGFIFLNDENIAYTISELNQEIIATRVATNEVFSVDSIPENKLTVPSTSNSAIYTANRKVPIGNNLTASALNLQSKPGAPHLLLLDFDGEDISSWGYNFPTVYASNYTEEQIRLVWEVIAADMLTFNINVTTNRKLYDDHLTSQKLICVFGEATGLNKVGGKSLVNIFGTGSGCLVNSKNGDKGIETAHIGSHEIGHAMGLMHDGTMWPGPSIPYYEGHADWAPIMGISYGKKYVTWSKGEYEFASQAEDDIAKIGIHAGFAVEDQTNATNLVIGKGDSLNFEQNNGIIENSNDVDTFQFELSKKGLIDLLISPAIEHTNLDIDISLLDENLQELYHSNLVLQRWEAIQQTVEAGKYYLVIKSGFENTADDGFTNYSSFGYYEITGSIENILKGEFDMSIAKVEGFNERCGDAVTGAVTIKNSGTQSITGGRLDIYINDNLTKTIQIYDEILPEGELELINISIEETLNNRLKFVYVSASNIEESIIENNSSALDYFIEKGNLMSFKTNLQTYDGKQPFSWKVTENNNLSNVLIEGASVDTELNGLFVQQTFCLESDCYDFNITGDFNLCNSYTSYQMGTTYLGGDIVAYNGNVYKAKWWTQKEPSSTSDWEAQGACNSGSYNTILTDETEGIQVYKMNSDDYLGFVEEEFCVDILSTATSEINRTAFEIYPNPVNDKLTVQSISPLENISIIDINGQLIQRINCVQKSLNINVDHLHSGIYFIQIGNGSIRKLIK